jgi:polyhydroxybutyrate depolymerase
MINLTRTPRATMLALLLAILVTACSDSSDSSDSSSPAGRVLQGCADTGTCVANPPLAIGGERQANVDIPVDYNTATRYPLLVVLHGFGGSGLIQALYFDLIAMVDTRQYVLVRPDGTMSDRGSRFWNSNAWCCAFTPEQQEIDDVAYIRGLIEEAAATYSIDPTRVGLIGHSNGGFMSLTMACEASELVTAVVSLAGSTFEEFESCQPASCPLSVLAVHGTDDQVIFYEGKVATYPGATETAERYAILAGCDASNPVQAGELDLVTNLPGADTAVQAYPGCLGDTEVELWTIDDGPHTPGPWQPGARDLFVDWLLDHPRG